MDYTSHDPREALKEGTGADGGLSGHVSPNTSIYDEPIVKQPDSPFGRDERPGYEDLAFVLDAAYAQAAHGKGKQRHANDQPFRAQRMQTALDLSGPGGAVYQVSKKTAEAVDLYRRGDVEAARREILGVINYAAGLHVWIDRQVEGE